MKITVNKILMLLQAIGLLAGHQVMAMEDHMFEIVVNNDEKNNQSEQNLHSIKREQKRGRSETRMRDNKNSDTFSDNSMRFNRSRSEVRTFKANDENVFDLDLLSNDIKSHKKQLDSINKSLIEKNAALNKAKEDVTKADKTCRDLGSKSEKYDLALLNWKHARDKRDVILKEISDLKLNKIKLEKNINEMDLYYKASKKIEKERKKIEKEKNDKKYKEWQNKQKENVIKVAKDAFSFAGNVAQGSIDKSIALAQTVGNGTIASAYYAKDKSIVLANNVATKATESIDYAKETKDAVKNSALVNNVFVNTLSALGTTVYNTFAGGVQKVDNYVRTGLDLFGPNIQQNLYIPLLEAQERYHTIADTDLGNLVLNNDDMSIALATDPEKVRAIQAVIELLVTQKKLDRSTMTDVTITAAIQQSLNVYKPIKELLEHVLSASYAEISDRHSLVTTLQNLPTAEKTEEKVKQQAELCKQTVINRFTEFKKQEEALLTRESGKELINKVDEKCAQYDDVMEKVHEAIVLYVHVFLIDAQLKSLVLVDKANIDAAIEQYNKYCDVLSKYKTAKKNIDENETIDLVKEEIVSGNIKNNADLVIKMTFLGKTAKTINSDLDNVCHLIDGYVVSIRNLLMVTSSTVVTGSYLGAQPVQDYLKNHVDFLNKNNGQLTTKQQEHIKSIINDIKTESDELYAVIKKCLSYGSKNNIKDIQTLHAALEKDKKSYKKPLLSDKMENISLEMLTVNRSEGIAELLKTHKSERKMITWAEDEQVAYADRQTKRKPILDVVDKAISGRCITFNQIANSMNALVNGDKLPTDKDLEKFDEILDGFIRDLENRSYKFTTQHRAFVEAVAQEAIEDAKQNVKIHIVAGWTVIGVMTKTAFEALEHTKGSSAKSIAKRGLGKALNAVRKGLIATGNKIAAENYHEEMREDAARKVKRGLNKVSDTIGQGLDALEEALESTQKPTLRRSNGSAVVQRVRAVRQHVASNIQAIVPQGNNSATFQVVQPGTLVPVVNNEMPLQVVVDNHQPKEIFNNQLLISQQIPVGNNGLGY